MPVQRASVAPVTRPDEPRSAADGFDATLASIVSAAAGRPELAADGGSSQSSTGEAGTAGASTAGGASPQLPVMMGAPGVVVAAAGVGPARSSSVSVDPAAPSPTGSIPAGSSSAGMSLTEAPDAPFPQTATAMTTPATAGPGHANPGIAAPAVSSEVSITVAQQPVGTPAQAPSAGTTAPSPGVQSPAAPTAGAHPPAAQTPAAQPAAPQSAATRPDGLGQLQPGAGTTTVASAPTTTGADPVTVPGSAAAPTPAAAGSLPHVAVDDGAPGSGSPTVATPGVTADQSLDSHDPQGEFRGDSRGSQYSPASTGTVHRAGTPLTPASAPFDTPAVTPTGAAAATIPSLGGQDGSMSGATQPAPAAAATATVMDGVPVATAPAAPQAAPTLSATSVSTPAPPPVPVPPPHHQVITAMSPLLRRADGSYTVAINLEPEQLGKVTVQLHLQAGQVAVSLQAADASARELLRDNLNALREQLEQQGVKAGQLDVGDGSSSAGHSQSSQGEAHAADNRIRGSRIAAAGPDETGSPDSSLRESTTGRTDDTGALDLQM